MSRARFVHDAMRALPPVPTPRGEHDFAIGLAIMGGAAVVAVGVWIYRNVRRAVPAAPVATTTGEG